MSWHHGALSIPSQSCIWQIRVKETFHGLQGGCVGGVRFFFYFSISSIFFLILVSCRTHGRCRLTSGGVDGFHPWSIPRLTVINVII